MPEIPTKPYLLRALYEWCVDNGYTPHLGVKTDAHTQVPTEHVRNGEITLNISPTAVHRLQMGNEVIEFSARFTGVARQISRASPHRIRVRCCPQRRRTPRLRTRTSRPSHPVRAAAGGRRCGA
jgi:hypothetical protein